ncbi:TetR/AcrR family transcriptional regulator [Bradyrhizobium sp. RDT10]
MLPPPVKRRTQSERREATRKLILDATVDVMVSLGIAGMRMEDVERKAGVSRGALLHHFSTKQDLVLAAFEYVNERSLESSQQRTQFAMRAGSVAEIIDVVLADASEFFFGQGFFVEFSLAFQQGNPELRGAAARLSRSARFAVEASWRKALESRGLPADVARDVLNLTLNTVRGFFVRRFLEDNPSERARLMQVWQDMVRCYLVDRLSGWADALEPAVPAGMTERTGTSGKRSRSAGARKGKYQSAKPAKKTT